MVPFTSSPTIVRDIRHAHLFCGIGVHHYPLGLSPWRPNRRDQKPGRELGCETAR